MATYGLTSTGLVVKTTDIVRTEINALLQAKFGSSVDVSNGSLLGQLGAIVAEREGAVWDLAQQVYSSQDPDQATGAALDALCLLSGVFRVAAKASTTTLTLTGTPTTIVASGSQAKTTSTGALFQTSASATITARAAWVALTVYAVGGRVTNGGNIYQCTAGGTSAAAGGPLTATPTNPDGSVTWRYLGAGTGDIDVAATSVLLTAIVGVSGDINIIQTPVGGWSNVINVLDAVAGNDVQTDASLRVARTAQLSSPGVATQNAIRAALLAVSGVSSVTVFVNNTDTVNVDSMPPHSVEALVLGGADQDILNALFGQVAAGIAYQGTTSGTVTDSQGVAQTVKFSRPAQILIYVSITVIKDPAFYPSDGDAQIRSAIAAYGARQLVGKDAVANSVGAQAFSVTGVLDVPRSGALQGVLIGTAASPTTDTTIVITSRQLAVFDTSRVVVTSSNGTP